MIRSKVIVACIGCKEDQSLQSTRDPKQGYKEAKRKQESLRWIGILEGNMLREISIATTVKRTRKRLTQSERRNNEDERKCYLR